MSTTTHREIASFAIESGATKDGLVSGFVLALNDIQRKAQDLGGTALWDITEFGFAEAEKAETSNIIGEVTAIASWPARLQITVPIVVTS